jgi:hypothetical protein
MDNRKKEKFTNRVKAEIFPPKGYIKKIINPGGDCPLSQTFSQDQVKRRIAFYQELNIQKKLLKRKTGIVHKKYALIGWKDTTTVHVYMRETVSKIVQELFFSEYVLSVENVSIKRENGALDKERGYVSLSLSATEPEIEALLRYIIPGASFFVYDGEKLKYVAGNTAKSEFIITKLEDPQQPERFWRRSQSFIYRVLEVEESGLTLPI